MGKTQFTDFMNMELKFFFTTSEWSRLVRVSKKLFLYLKLTQHCKLTILQLKRSCYWSSEDGHFIWAKFCIVHCEVMFNISIIQMFTNSQYFNSSCIYIYMIKLYTFFFFILREGWCHSLGRSSHARNVSFWNVWILLLLMHEG